MRSKQEVKERIEKLVYYYESYSCSEGVLRILTDVYDELLPPEVLRLGSINRGGACVDGRCGILESTMLFLSYIYGRNNSDDDYLRLEYWIDKIHDKFNETMCGYTCRDIWYPTNEKISKGEFIPKTHCIISEGLIAISDLIYDAYQDLRNYTNHESKNNFREDNDFGLKNIYKVNVCNSVIARSKQYIEMGYICSEAALRALVDEMGFNWSEQQKKIATVYQKGGAFGDRCGVIEVVLLLLSDRYGRLDSREMNLQDRMLSRRLHEIVTDKVGSVLCRELVDIKRGIESNCPKMEAVIKIAVDFIEDADTIIANELDSFAV